MATPSSIRFVVAPIGFKNPDIIAKLPKISRKRERAIFTFLFIASLSIGAAGVGESVLGWYIPGLWLFLASALIYTPDLIRIELVVWGSLAVHLGLQVTHSAVKGDQPWLTSSAAFVNALAVLLKNIPLHLAGIALAVAQAAVTPTSNYQYASIGFAAVPLFINIARKLRNRFL